MEPLQRDIQEVKADIATIKEDIAEIKEEAAITRHTSNLLLRWAEKADRTAVNVGLYDEEKEA